MKLSSTSSHFANNPSVHIKRSKFKVPVHTHKTTFNNGELIPIKCMEILPGDTVSFDMASVVRMSTPVKPVFDNVFLDTFFFFVPRRLTWKHWREFMGENTTGPWRSSVTYNLPHTFAPNPTPTIVNKSGGNGYWLKERVFTSFEQGSSSMPFEKIRDSGMLYYGTSLSQTNLIHVGSSDIWSVNNFYYILYTGWDVGSLGHYITGACGSYMTVDSGYFRGYALIWNEFFRDQNYMDFTNTEVDLDSDVQGVSRVNSSTSLSPGYDYVSDPVRGGHPLNVSRFHDYFSSVLPEPQFGDAVAIPFDGLAPVKNGSLLSTDPNWFIPAAKLSAGGSLSTSYVHNLSLPGHVNGSFGFIQTKSNSSESYSASDYSNIVLNLGADVNSVAGTIMDLRNAFQVQKFLERSARYGNRYIEMLLGQFGVVNPDYRLQRPELLASFRKVLNMTQVLQTSSTDTVSPQGNTSAYSLTADPKHSCFTKSFTEHGILYCLVCTRTSRSYQQGLNRQFSRRKKLDFYFPVFAHISEQPVLVKEIYNHYRKNQNTSYSADGSKFSDDVFGYQEAWGEYRYQNSMITGEFSSMAPQSLDFWHYADYYESQPIASDSWLFELPDNLDRTLAVTSGICNQFLADFAFDITIVRPMPLYSIPGLADHF